MCSSIKTIRYLLGCCLVALLGLLYIPTPIEANDCTVYTLIGHETSGGIVELTDIQAGDCPENTPTEHTSATTKQEVTTLTADQYILAGFFTILTVLLVGVCIAVYRTYPASCRSFNNLLFPSKRKNEHK